MSNQQQPAVNIRAPIVAVLLLLLLNIGLSNFLRSPVQVIPSTAPGTVFSGDRAYSTLAALIAENTAHPAGSAENKVLKNRIVERLSELGLTSEIQSDFKCSYLAPGCSVVENIIAVIKGSDSDADAKAILLTAHYDSVPGSVGAADDMAGVAAMLEIATNVTSMPVFSNDIILLFSDAEETGLRGAMAFADSHPLMDKVGLVLNMEARGVTGSSMMFETGPGNINQIAGFKAETSHPNASSLTIEIYKRMPNATDYLIYGMRNLPGLNYSFSQGVSLYHSQKDDLEHLDVRSLQHQGDNLSSAIRAFGNKDLNALPADEDATYFDLFGLYLVSWPESVGPILAAIALVSLLFTAWRSSNGTIRQSFWSMGLICGVFISMPLLGWALSFPLGQFGGLHGLDHPFPWPARISLLAATLSVACLGAMVARRKTGSDALFTCVWVLFAAMGLALAVSVSGASYIFTAPALVAGLTGAALSIVVRHRAIEWAAYAGLLAAAYMAMYHFYLLEVVFNFQLSHFKMAELLLLALPLLPVLALWFDRGGPGIRLAMKSLLGIAAVSTVIAMLVPAYTEDRPRSVNVVYHSDLTNNKHHWEIQTIGPADAQYLQKAGFDETAQTFLRYGVQASKTHMMNAEDLSIHGPDLHLDLNETVDGEQVISGTISSPRGADIMGFAFKDSSAIAAMTIENQLVLGSPERPLSGSKIVRIHGVGTRPVSFVITPKKGTTTKAWVFDQGALPKSPAAIALQDLRPQTAAPIHSGDNSLMMQSFSLDAL